MLFALSAAMVPAAFLWTGGAEAQDAPASSRYAVGSPGMLAAQDIARRTWGADPCGGQVEVVWGTDEPLINARSYWANPRSAYDAPDLNSQCRIVFNTGLQFTWEKFCTVLVHEYGHLAGRPHSSDGPDVMSPIYRAPIPDCANAPDPAASPAAPAPTPAPTPQVTPAEAIDAPRTRRQSRRAKARTARLATQTRARGRAVAEAPDPLLRFSAAYAAGHEHAAGHDYH